MPGTLKLEAVSCVSDSILGDCKGKGVVGGVGGAGCEREDLN